MSSELTTEDPLAMSPEDEARTLLSLSRSNLTGGATNPPVQKSRGEPVSIGGGIPKAAGVCKSESGEICAGTNQTAVRGVQPRQFQEPRITNNDPALGEHVPPAKVIFFFACFLYTILCSARVLPFNVIAPYWLSTSSSRPPSPS